MSSRFELDFRAAVWHDQYVMTTTTETGHWTLTTIGGTTQYCSLGQHFTTGKVWQYFVGLVSKKTICAECAEKECGS